MANQQTQTPCPHCGELVYVLSTQCVRCRGPLRFNPAVQKGSLEAYRILTGWKPPVLPDIDKPAGTPAAETPIVDSHPLSPLKEKWPREQYARDAIIRLKENPALQSNVSDFCRTIAEEKGIPEIAGSLKKLLYQADYQRLWKS